MFKGRDMHSGSSPYVHESLSHSEDMIQTLEELDRHIPGASSPNRVGLVSYWSTPSVERSAACNVCPETRFGNHGTLHSSLANSLNYAENGQHLLGLEQEAKSRLAWEHVLSFQNALTVCGINIDITTNEILSKMRYRSVSDEDRPIIPYPIDISDPSHVAQSRLYQAYYQHLYTQCQRYFISTTKASHRSSVRALETAASRSLFQLGERIPVEQENCALPINSNKEGEAEYRIKRIIGRCYNAKKKMV
jgi:hypothetical protein